MYHTISQDQFVNVVLFRRLVFITLSSCGGVTFLLCIQRTTVAEWIFIAAAPLRGCHRDTYGGRSHPSIVMPCQDCSARRTFAQSELRVFEPVSELQSDTADGASDIILTVCHRHGREVIHKLACFSWRRKLRAFQNVVEYHPRNPVSQGAAGQYAIWRAVPHHLSCTEDSFAEVRLHSIVEQSF